MSNEIEKKTVKITEMAELRAWAELGLKGGIAPETMSVYQGMAAVQLGKEIGLSPFMAMSNIYFIKGRAAINYKLIYSIACRDYGVSMSKPPIEEPGKCAVFLKREGFPDVTATYTLEEARKAGIVKAGGAWDTRTREMVFKSALKLGLVRICPEACLGLLDIDEARSLKDTGKLTAQVIFPSDSPLELPQDAQNAPVPLTDEDLRVQTAEKQPEPVKAQHEATPAKRGRPAKTLTKEQIEVKNMIAGFCKQVGITDAEDFRRDLQTRHGVAHLNEATAEQCNAMSDDLINQAAERQGMEQ